MKGRLVACYGLLLSLVPMPFAIACHRSQAADSKTSQVDKLFAAWNRTDSPGCAVGISRNGEVVYEHGYGMANLELRVPVTPDTVFALASITKSFTAMSVMLAVQQGKLSLDDEVQKYIPEWKDRDDHITVRHLLSHTSGIRDAFTLLGWTPGGYAGDTNAAIVKTLARQRGLNFAPGTKYEYNNGGYALIASILKRATGQSLGVFAAANIFKPLGMTHSSLREDPTTLMPGRAPGYTRQVDGWHLVLDAQGPGVVGNGGMYSTVGDLLTWMENFDHPRVGTPEMFASMQKPTVLTDGTTSSYGLGVPIGDYRGAPAFEFSGGDRGMATKVMRFPQQRFSVAALCNEDSVVTGGMSRVNPDVFTNGIADIYLADVTPSGRRRGAGAGGGPVSCETVGSRSCGKSRALSCGRERPADSVYRESRRADVAFLLCGRLGLRDHADRREPFHVSEHGGMGVHSSCRRPAEGMAPGRRRASAGHADVAGVAASTVRG